MAETLGNLPELEKTKNVYGLPVPKGTVIHGLVYESRSHSGPSQGAIDIDVELDTPILAPLAGTIVKVVIHNDKQGPTANFAQYNNVIIIRHGDDKQGYEYSRFSHMPKDSNLVNVNDVVQEGDPIARCGFVGATTKPHIHWMVYKEIEEKPGFQSLKIQLKKPLEDLMTK